MLRVVASATAVLALAGAVLSWMLVGLFADLADSLSGWVNPEDDAIALVAESQDVVAVAARGVSDIGALAANFERGGRDTADALHDAGRLIEEDVAGSLASVEQAMPALVDAGRVIDATLRTLSIFGVDYNPEVPFDQALLDVQSSLDGLPAEVRAQGAEMRRLAPTVDQVADDTVRAIATLETVGSRLDDVAGTLESIEDSASTAGSLGTAAAAVSSAAPALRAMIVVCAGAGIVLSVATWRLAAAPARPGAASESRREVAGT